MTVELPANVEKELRDLAALQRRAVGQVVEEAVRLYLEAAAITDLSTGDVAETQLALAGELDGISAWKAGRD